MPANKLIVALLSLPLLSATTRAQSPAFYDWAQTPPMGWNSWDCFGAGVTEADTFANADYIDQHLKSHGWTIVTIDIQWYEPTAHANEYRPNAVLEMDANGRLLPAANRFPMTAASRSFKPIADALHARGLKFGLHLLRGIPRQAVQQNVPILGAGAVHAADIADITSICRWNGDMYGVDMTKPGAQAYYDSVFALLASWDLDLVKVDDLSAPYHKAEIEAIRTAIDKCGRPIIFSTSPGETPLGEGEHVANHANMWRVSDDFWDSWPSLYSQFARLNNWTPFRGPGHWPDADMLPLGNIRTWNPKGNRTHFTRDEQITLMTLWCIARSPLIVGANLPKNDEFTLSLLTNDDVLAVNQRSTNNRQVWRDKDHIVWTADMPDSKDKYLALFNASPAPTDRARRSGPASTRSATTIAAGSPPAVNPAATQPATVAISLADMGFTGPCEVRDLWTHQDLARAADTISATVNSHGAVLYRVDPER